LPIAVGVVLADAGYGNGTPFRIATPNLDCPMVGIESSTTAWEPGQQPLRAPPRKPGRANRQFPAKVPCLRDARGDFGVPELLDLNLVQFAQIAAGSADDRIRSRRPHGH
jgi:hypothetical protein